ncbi:Hypothetical Protein FCC1311_080902 [Hondaea fermentalgiana]|uniref:Uncharacterized protein n=1 Tax=Hondaea fermentalgiana TaxID=2315210 RepID=A0A2R5GMK9_9STRA|nr:Hypothetical Protein FCC1311_080902 [Hondaea fermentalgiana]|eukprot:GBG31865.1 Hypothetical Protein FCC1311_080902 [Hondaea fermentalgiana]
MFARKLGYEGSVKRVKRSFGRGIPFELETRKRQAVSCGLPKVETDAAPSQQKHTKTNNNNINNNNASKENVKKTKKTAAKDPVRESAAGAEAAAPMTAAAPPVYNRESRLEDAQTVRKSKSICFAEGTKTWMGLRRERHFTDELLHQFFVLGQKFSSVDVVRLIGMDAQLIGGVRELLDDLCLRIVEQSKSEEEGVPVLLHGGGRGMKVSIFHHPYLVSLQRVVAEAERVSALRFTISDTSPRDNTSSSSEGEEDDDDDARDEDSVDTCPRDQRQEDQEQRVNNFFDLRESELDDSSDPLAKEVSNLRNVHIHDPSDDEAKTAHKDVAVQQHQQQQQQQHQPQQILAAR